MAIETEEKKTWQPDRNERVFRVQPTPQLATDVQSGGSEDYPIRLLDISETGAKISIEKQLRTGEEIRLRLMHQELGLEIAVPAMVCWCNVKKDTWEAGVEFVDATIETDTLGKLALDGIVEHRSSDRHDVELDARMQKPGDPETQPIIIKDISNEGICIVSETLVETGDRLLLTLETGDSESISFVAIACWRKKHGSAFQIGCRIPTTQGRSFLKKFGVGIVAAEQEIVALRRKVSRLTWSVMLLCATCSCLLAFSNYILPSGVISELQQWTFDTSRLGW